MAPNEQQSSPVPIHARLKAIEITGDVKKKRSHFLTISLDDEVVLERTEKKPSAPALRWEWPEPGHEFSCHPSSILNVKVYRNKGRIPGIKRLVGELSCKVIDVLENDAGIDLNAEDGTTVNVRIALSVQPATTQDFKTFMESVDANVSRLASSAQIPSGLATIGTALQFTKKIMDAVAATHPILNASWIVLSATYSAVQEVELQDESVRDLAEQLRETLGLAKERPNLLVVEGTTNVIEEIGRLSLKTTSLIYEYTKSNFAGRTVKLQLSHDLKERISSCQKSCIELRNKFQSRLILKIDGDGVQIQRKLDVIQNDQLAIEIWKWLSAPDSSPNYNAALEKHQDGTFDWFLDGELFSEYVTKPGFLWIKGTSGCGKTVLCSAIINKITRLLEENQDSSHAYAHFFFDGRDSQNELQRHDKLIRSLIRQLSAQCDGIPTALVDLYGQGHQQPSTSSLQDTLHRIMKGFNSVHIVIDSLDECVEREKTLPWIRHMTSQEIDNVHMVVASRPEPDITDVLRPLNTTCLNLAEMVNEDIAKYLDQELQRLNKWDDDTRYKVKTALHKGAQGMFRWVALQLIELRKCSTKSAVMKQLQNLPKGLYETYDQILSKIDAQTDSTDTKTFLRLLSFSIRPMTLKEIAASVAVEFKEDSDDEPQYEPLHQYWDEDDVLAKCSGLITQTDNGGYVKLSHFSVKEYLLSDHLRIGALSTFYLISAEHSHCIISQICLAYLLHFDSPDILPGPLSLSYHWRESFPLARYAAEYWIDHTRFANIDKSETSVMWALACRLFDPDCTTLTNWVRIRNIEHSWEDPDPEHSLAAIPLYYASLAGAAPVVQHLLKDGADVNTAGGYYGSALQVASLWGHTTTVELLLKHGADVNLAGGRFGNALQAASMEGHTAIVELLLKHGADANLTGGYYSSALQAASERGHTAIIELLLEHGADVNLEGGRFGSALQVASLEGHTTIVELLLEHGADVNLTGGRYGSALQVASLWGYTTIVELLLKHGADANLARGENGSSLREASVAGHAGIVELLLKHGADANLAGGKNGSSLQEASAAGHAGIVELLLEHEADVNLAGGRYGSALQAASCWGHTAIAELLLEHGADVNLAGGRYGSALQAASQGGHTKIVELLLKYGVDINLEGRLDSALQAASAEGYDDIVQLLQDAQKEALMAGSEN